MRRSAIRCLCWKAGSLILDEITATAAIFAAISPGHLKATKTTLAMTGADVTEAMRKAGTVTFRGPRK